MADTTIDTGEKIMAGILLTSFAYFLFSVHDAVVKLLVVSVSVWQVMFFRSTTILVGCGLIGGRKLFRESVASPIVKSMLLRSFLILAAWLCFYTAARDLQLAELTTIYFAAPVIVTVLSILILGEQVPATRWVAVLTGFVGVFIACNPLDLGFSGPVLLVLAAAAFWALSIVLLRRIATRERTLVQLVLNNLFFVVVAGIGTALTWHTPDLGELALLLGAGMLGGVAQFALFDGMKRAPISIIAPFEYTSLIWSFVLGYLIWSDLPRTEVFYGAALIMAAGLIIILGERRRRAA
ncbi:DMT family transporter [Aquamicrobium sp. LC103]|uniref:DMT family transporter n=1 Tax=Aquamicrobium sp. LC103 TaxID=1120658 RepID=UPI00063E9DC2|nr:DMT family transporter [Aquamicrobium sp. LC103]TKT81335.1 DMT family transporter [Aquamicrobium sp. LC103]